MLSAGPVPLDLMFCGCPCAGATPPSSLPSPQLPAPLLAGTGTRGEEPCSSAEDWHLPRSHGTRQAQRRGALSTRAGGPQTRGHEADRVAVPLLGAWSSEERRQAWPFS